MGICKVNKKVQLLIQTPKYNSGNTNNNQFAGNLLVADQHLIENILTFHNFPYFSSGPRPLPYSPAYC